MLRRTTALIFTVFLVLDLGFTSDMTNWPQFRGPGGLGIAQDSQKLPVEFDQTNNMIWKSEVSKGNSSPCIWGDRIFITGLTDKKLETICLDRNSGKIYVPSARGVITVFAPGDDLNVLARNDLKERMMATPAIVDGTIYVRTENNVYAFGLSK